MHWCRIVLLSLLALVVTAGVGCNAIGFRDTSYQPQINASDFQATVDNPYCPLVPGTVLTYLEKEGDESRENTIEVTSDTKMIMGVKCVVVHDVVKENGDVKEDTFDWMAQDKEGTVWYFGEATKEFKAGGRVSTEGSWEAGVKGAQPGILMPAHPAPGAPYRQEYAPGEAEDMGQVVATDETVKVPAGSFTGCVKTKEWSLLEAGHEHKWYAKGVGVVRTESTGGEVVTLTSIKRP